MKKFAIITDFDGTITTRDIGNALCFHYGTMKKDSPLVKDYDTKEDPSIWFNKFFGPIKANQQEFESIILSYKKEKKGFEELAKFAQEHKIPFEIVSNQQWIDLVSEVDKDGDCQISFEEFKEMMQKISNMK